MIFEFHFFPFRDWLKRAYEANKDLADASMQEAMEEVAASEISGDIFMEPLRKWAERPKSLKYRHWKEGETARSSLHFFVADPPEEE